MLCSTVDFKLSLDFDAHWWGDEGVQILDWMNINCRFGEYCFFGRKDLEKILFLGRAEVLFCCVGTKALILTLFKLIKFFGYMPNLPYPIIGLFDSVFSSILKYLISPA